jgi:hypothetical protein
MQLFYGFAARSEQIFWEGGRWFEDLSNVFSATGVLDSGRPPMPVNYLDSSYAPVDAAIFLEECAKNLAISLDKAVFQVLIFQHAGKLARLDFSKRSSREGPEKPQPQGTSDHGYRL